MAMKCPSCGFEFDRRDKRLPICETKPGCILIAQNIECYSSTALFLLFAGKGFRRMPYILTLLGMDEAGKVLKIIKRTIASKETDVASVVVIENWYAHWSKGTEAGELGVLAVEWLGEVSKNDPFLGTDGLPKDTEFLTGYRAHLQKLKENYSNERNSMLYANYNEGSNSWPNPDIPELGFVLFDALLLDIFSKIVINHLSKGGTFLTLNDAIMEIKGCSNFAEAMSKLDGVAGTNLSRALKSTNE